MPPIWWKIILIAKIIDFIRPLIAQGRTRFIIAGLAIIAIAFLSYKGCDQNDWGKITIAAVAFIYIISKTTYDIVVGGNGH